MNQSGSPQSLPRWMFLGFAVALSCGTALLAGCKGNTTAAAIPDHRVSPPPTIQATRTTADLRLADPLTSPLWKDAHWSEFVSPINTTHTTPPTRCSVMFDDQNLYLAVISRAPSGNADCVDKVSFFLDTTARGNQLLEFRIDAGKLDCNWMRSEAAAQPLDDGTPNLGFPVGITPGIEIKGLWSQTFTSADADQSTRALVIGVPLASLPGSMRLAPNPAAPWKMNVVRTITIAREDGHTQRLESDLSPIYSGAQAVSPYRMADLKFASQ